MADPLKNGIKLIVAIGGFVAKPSLLDGLRTGVEIRDLARNLLARAPPDIGTMADDLTAEAEAIFRAMAQELPPDAPILFEQMVEIALPDPRQIVADGMDAGRIVATMLACLTQIEHTRAPMPDLFRAIVTPAFARLLESRSFADDLTPAFMAGVLGGMDRIEGKIDNLGTRLENIAAQSREALNAMALRFGEPAPEDMSLPALQDFLTKKARDYRALKAEVEAIPDGLKRLSNLKAAARGAIEAGDLDAVETLLSRVQEVELDEAAKTAELRADNALLRGRAEQAFTILSAAADSFAAIDPLEPARRRIGYEERLYDHGLRYGGPGLALAARMLRAALRVVTEADHPVDWAMTQENMALAEEAIAAHDSTVDPRPHLEAALDHVEAAMRIFNPERMAYGYETAIALRDRIAGKLAALSES